MAKKAKPETIVVGPAVEDVEPEVKGIVSASGVAVGETGTNLGKLMEEAMSAEIMKISKETEEIAADTSKSDEEKQAEIAELTDPENQKARMMEARQAVKDQFSAG